MKRCLHNLFWVICLTVSITACTQDTPTSGTIRVHLLSEPRSLHPVNSTVSTKDYILRYTHERLNTIDLETGELIPQLAGLPETSEDNLSYTFTLKSEATWPDGQPLTAQDVVFTFKAVACPGVKTQLKAYLDYLEDIQPDPENPRRFTVRMKSYYMNNPNFGIYTFILDPRRYDPEGILNGIKLTDLLAKGAEMAEDSTLKTFADQFNAEKYGREVEALQGGSGPYRMDQWESEQFVSLVKNESYWGQEQKGPLFAQEADTIQFVFQREDLIIENLFKAKELDISSYLSGNVFEGLKESATIEEAFTLHEGRLGSYVCLSLNNQPEAFGRPAILSEKAVRQALDMGIDKEGIRTEALRGFARPAFSPLRPDNALFNPELEARGYNPEAAARMLDEAGWQDTNGDGVREKMQGETLTPLQLTLFYADNSQGIRQMADRLKADWAKVGVELILKPGSLGQYIQDVYAGNYDVALISLGASPLPYDFKQLFHSDQWRANSYNNFSGFVNARADSLIDALRVSAEPDSQREMAWEVQEILLEEVPMISLYFTTRKQILSKRFGKREPLRELPFYYINSLPVSAD